MVRLNCEKPEDLDLGQMARHAAGGLALRRISPTRPKRETHLTKFTASLVVKLSPSSTLRFYRSARRYFITANFRRYFSATSNSWGRGAVIVSGSLVVGCLMVSSLACSANRAINGFSSSRPL